jgi:hypothetical protein
MRLGRILGIAAVAMAGVAAAVGVATTVSSCGSSPTNVPVRSFEQAQNVDYLCVAYNSPDGGAALPPTQNFGLNPNLCTQVPLGITGSTLDNHMVAVVTQTTRGEVAVVDLTAGNIIDESHDLPGVNFIPVGKAPTGIVVAPDAQMTFVSSADTNKPAIYGIPTNARQVPLGDGGDDAGVSTIGGLFGDSAQVSPFPTPLQLTDLPVCALTQPPLSIAITPLSPKQGGPPAGYVLVATLGQSGASPPQVVTIDPTGLLRGVGLDVDAGATDAGDAGTRGASPVTPGILALCPILGSAPLATASTLPSTWDAGPAWADGVPYADAGDLASQEPTIGPVGPGCIAPEAGPIPLPIGFGALPSPAFAVMRDDLPVLYVGDAQLPVIHVFDVSDPTQPVERAPLLATSVGQPTRVVSVGALAISPVTRNYQRFLYAVDTADGSVMVYDVTDPVNSPHTPLERPHSELNPLAPRDRLSFSSPVATVGFALHDWPVIPPGPNGSTNPDQTHASTGLLCNPNPNASFDAGNGDASVVLDNGYYYTMTQVTVPLAAGTVQTIPQRLRGVFGFVTLATGQVVTIDVDDWDAPCRRPDPMAIDPALNYGMTGLLDIPESPPGPPGSPTFLDPYAAPFPEPTTQVSSVTQEAFFPVSAQNRMRSAQLLRDDPTAGNNAPNILSPPTLTDVTGAAVGGTTAGAAPPLILPTALAPGFIDPSLITDPTDPPASQTLKPDASITPSPTTTAAIRLSFDDPTATQSQTWAVTYEGALPTVSNLAADIQSPGGSADDAGTAFQTLTLTIGQEIPGPDAGGFPVQGAGAGFCERGIEDWDIGTERAQQAVAAMTAANLPPPPNLPEWTADYVEILDDPLPQGDVYWNVKNPCWEGLVDGTTDLSPTPASTGPSDPQPLADARYNSCNQAFGTGTPDTFLGRDLPILRAYDDHLDVGRFYWPSSVVEATTNRRIVGQDPGNVNALKFVACCFHNQATFKVRTGGEWVAVGQNGVGFLHRVIASPAPPEIDPLTGLQGSRRCVLSCDPHDVLLNSRSFDIPWTPIPWGTSSGETDAGSAGQADASTDGGRDAEAEAGVPPGPLVCALPSNASQDVLRTNPLAFENPYFSYVTWMACALPGSRFDHTVTPRDDTWRFQIAGGFAPLTISLTGNTIADVSPQSMRYIAPLGVMAVVDGQSEGLEIIDLNAVVVVHNYE